LAPAVADHRHGVDAVLACKLSSEQYNSGPFSDGKRRFPMKRFAAVLMLLVLALFALPTLAATPQEAACAQERDALQAQMKQLQADMSVFNSECGGARSKSEYVAHNCAQRGAQIDQRNANLAAAAKSFSARCNK
jgi:hypothetical protein